MKNFIKRALLAGSMAGTVSGEVACMNANIRDVQDVSVVKVNCLIPKQDANEGSGAYNVEVVSERGAIEFADGDERRLDEAIWDYGFIDNGFLGGGFSDDYYACQESTTYSECMDDLRTANQDMIRNNPGIKDECGLRALDPDRGSDWWTKCLDELGDPSGNLKGLRFECKNRLLDCLLDKSGK